MARRSGINAPEERLKILKEGETEGIQVTCRKYGISHDTYYRWKDSYERGGLEALRPKKGNQIDPELKRLREENAKLKEILAEKELALRIKEDLLKKTLQKRRSS